MLVVVVTVKEVVNVKDDVVTVVVVPVDASPKDEQKIDQKWSCFANPGHGMA